MTQYKKIFLIILGAILILSLPLKAFSFDDAILAVVNQEVITLKDLQDYLHTTYISLQTDGVDHRQIEAIMRDLESTGLQKLIEDRIILSHANTLKIEVPEKLIDERLQQLRDQYKSEQNLLADLVNNGSTINELRTKIRDQFKIKFAIEQEVRSKITVNPKDVTDFFEQNKDQFKRKELFNLQSIYIAFGTSKLAARAKIEAALNKIKKGEDFNEVAQNYSDTPSLGVIERGQLREDIELEIAKLSENQISEIVEVDSGYFIFKLLNHTPEKQASLEEVKNIVQEVVYRRKFKERFDKWLSKLKSEAYIEVKK